MPKAVLSLFVFFAVVSSTYGANAGGLSVNPKRLIIDGGKQFAYVKLVNSSAMRQRFEVITVNSEWMWLGVWLKRISPQTGSFLPIG